VHNTNWWPFWAAVACAHSMPNRLLPKATWATRSLRSTRSVERCFVFSSSLVSAVLSEFFIYWSRNYTIFLRFLRSKHFSISTIKTVAKNKCSRIDFRAKYSSKNFLTFSTIPNRVLKQSAVLCVSNLFYNESSRKQGEWKFIFNLIYLLCWNRLGLRPYCR